MGRLRSTAGAAAAVLVLTGALAGCGASGSGEAEEAGGGDQSITIGVGYIPSTTDLDPRDASSQQVAPVVSQSLAGTLFSYNGLETDPNSNDELVDPQPELATGAELSDDGLTWTVSLRPDVVSQWGNTLTAEDVVWTIDRAFETQGIAFNLISQTVPLDPADPVEAIDDQTVEFHLTKPSSLLEKVFAQPWLGIFDSKAVAANAAATDPWGYEWLNTNSASYGPYEVVTSELPQRLVVKASPTYFRGPAEIDQATYVLIAENSVRLQSALTGEIDMATGLASTDLPAIEGAGSVEPYAQPNALTQKQLAFNVNSPEVSDPDVRRAIALAVDRQAIADTIYEGLATPITGCMPALLYDGTSDLDVTADADPDAAKELLDGAAAGPRTVTIGYLPDNGDVFPQLIQDDLATVGITATLKPYTALATWQADFQNGVFSVALNGFAPFVNDPGYLLLNLITGKALSNRTGYANATVDEAAVEALSASGDAKTEAVRTACEQVQTDTPIAPLVSTGQLAAVNERVTTVAAYQYAVLLYNMRVG